ncbi:MAG: hypothetical protein ABS939_00370 [Psychrobacillus sp.]
MIARFLKDGDPRLEEVSDFSIQTVGEDGKILNSEWHGDSTFDKEFEKLAKKHRKGLEISVLDYGYHLQATVTVNEASVNYHYRVMKLLRSREILREIGYVEELLNNMTDEDCENEVMDIYNQ